MGCNTSCQRNVRASFVEGIEAKQKSEKNPGNDNVAET
jgi:hypothetical protein